LGPAGRCASAGDADIFDLNGELEIFVISDRTKNIDVKD